MGQCADYRSFKLSCQWALGCVIHAHHTSTYVIFWLLCFNSPLCCHRHLLLMFNSVCTYLGSAKTTPTHVQDSVSREMCCDQKSVIKKKGFQGLWRLHDEGHRMLQQDRSSVSPVPKNPKPAFSTQHGSQDRFVLHNLSSLTEWCVVNYAINDHYLCILS